MYFTDIIIILNLLIEYAFVAYEDSQISKLNYNYRKILNFNWNTRKISIIVELLSSISINFMKSTSNLIPICIILKISFIKYFFKWISFKHIFKNKDNIANMSTNSKVTLKNLISFIFNTISNHQKIKIFFFFTLVIHIFSCLWVHIGLDSFYSLDQCWIKIIEYDTDNIFQIYIASVYFVITTLLTVGFGDIYPTNINEYLFVIVMLFNGGLIYSFILTIISSLFVNLNKRSLLYNERILTLGEIKRNYNLNDKLYKNTLNAINFNFKHWKLDNEELIMMLPSSLKLNLQFKMYEDLIMNIKFLKNLSKSQEFNEYEIKGFLTTLIPKLSYQTYKQHDIILDKGDYIEDMFFITYGSITISTSYNDTSINLLKFYSGTHFGDILMDTFLRSPIAIRCNSKSCKIMVLKKTDFIELKSKYNFIIIHMLESSLNTNNLLTLKLKESEKYYETNGNLNGFKQSFIDYSKTFKFYEKDNKYQNITKYDQITQITEKNEDLDKTLIKKESIIKRLLNKTLKQKTIFVKPSKDFIENNETVNLNNELSSKMLNNSKSYREDTLNLIRSYSLTSSYNIDYSKNQIVKNETIDKDHYNKYSISAFTLTSNFKEIEGVEGVDNTPKINIKETNNITNETQDYSRARTNINSKYQTSRIRADYQNRKLSIYCDNLKIIKQTEKSNQIKKHIKSIEDLTNRNSYSMIEEISNNMNNVDKLSKDNNIINEELSKYILSQKKSKISILRSRERLNTIKSKSTSPLKLNLRISKFQKNG